MDYNSGIYRPHMTGQRGAALVEFAFVFVVFITLLFAIIEFSLLVFDASRLAEATRAATRYAIVNDPACDIYGKGGGINCSGGPMTCPGGDPVTITIDASDCSFPDEKTECKMVEEMDQMMGNNTTLQPEYSILAGRGIVTVTYACSATGDPAIPGFVPVVTVEAIDIIHPMLLSNFMAIGLDTDCTPYAPPCVTLPRFQTSRTGEDMYTETEIE